MSTFHSVVYPMRPPLQGEGTGNLSPKIMGGIGGGQGKQGNGPTA